MNEPELPGTELCSECGAAKPVSMGSLCPNCLLRIGLEPTDETGQAGSAGTSLAKLRSPNPRAGVLEGRSSGGNSSKAEGSTLPERTRPPAERIGPYKILELLGQGGMGEVYLAEQVEPIHRRVAVKVIKAGMDTRRVIARFESERQALALMNHPSIARVFDAGATPRGRPYFAMEYVPGSPITDYCDAKKLDTRQRLELFLEVCAGVQHAHQKGIIHRDLKPSNVLVTLQDDRPAPKIIDFGLAKATGRRLTEKTLHTEMGVLMGTPEYMSPEQVEFAGQDIDTRTDVYSLGAMLYELLAGAKPFDSARLRSAGFDELRRIIRETDPPTPSRRLNTLGEVSNRVGELRGVQTLQLKKQLEGDLDWITMQALEKDRGKRYASAGELAADIQRHLNDEPVLAIPPSVAYRGRKFARRHRLGVATAAILAVGLLLGVAGIGYGLVRALRAEAVALREAETARQVSDFLVGLFEVVDPGESRGNTITAREILDRGAGQIEKQLADQPAVQAAMQETIGRVYGNLGLYPEARAQLESALETRAKLFGEDSLEVAATLYTLAEMDLQLGVLAKPSLPGARRALEIRRKLLAPDDLRVADSLRQTADAMNFDQDMSEDMAEAERLALEALEIRRKHLGEEHVLVAECYATLAGIISWANLEYERGEPFWRRSMDLYRKILGEDHPRTLKSSQGLSNHFLRKGDYYAGKGESESAKASYKAAEPLLTNAIDARKRVLGPRHPIVARDLNELAMLRSRQGKYQEAVDVGAEARSITLEAFGPDHERTLLLTTNLAHRFWSAGNLEQARSYLLEVLEQIPPGRRTRGELSRALLPYILLENSLGQEDQALDYLREELARPEIEAEPPVLLARLYSLYGEVLDKHGQPEQAREWFEKSLQIFSARNPESQNPQPVSDSWVGVALKGLARYEGAEAVFSRALSTPLQDPPGAYSICMRILDLERIIDLYEKWEKSEKATAYREELDRLSRIYGSRISRDPVSSGSSRHPDEQVSSRQQFKAGLEKMAIGG